MIRVHCYQVSIILCPLPLGVHYIVSIATRCPLYCVHCYQVSIISCPLLLGVHYIVSIATRCLLYCFHYIVSISTRCPLYCVNSCLVQYENLKYCIRHPKQNIFKPLVFILCFRCLLYCVHCYQVSIILCPFLLGVHYIVSISTRCQFLFGSV